MFKQKLKEILELTLEAADKTETYISYHYGNQSESLSVFVGEEVLLFQTINIWKRAWTKSEKHC